MYGANDKAAVLGRVSSVKSIENTVPVDEIVIDDDIDVGSPVVDINDLVEGKTYEEPKEDTEDVSGSDISSGDVSCGDVSCGDVSLGDVSGGSVVIQYSSCLYEPKPNLWESDIKNYDTTDGLLLLILVFTVINTVCNVYWRR